MCLVKISLFIQYIFTHFISFCLYLYFAPVCFVIVRKEQQVAGAVTSLAVKGQQVCYYYYSNDLMMIFKMKPVTG